METPIKVEGSLFSQAAHLSSSTNVRQQPTQQANGEINAKTSLDKPISNTNSNSPKSGKNLSKPLIPCSLCPKQFKKPDALNKHFVNIHIDDSNKSFQCQICTSSSTKSKNKCKKFIDQKSLDRHTRLIHGPPKFECEICSRKFKDSSNLNKHKRVIHEGKKSFHCEFCFTPFSTKCGLRQHLLTRHKQEQKSFDFAIFTCEFCKNIFLFKSELENHVIEAHVVDKPFECEICYKTFLDEEQLASHLEKHNSNKIKKNTNLIPNRFICDVCSEEFTRKVNLVHHLKKKHDKSFFCLKCSRSFQNQSELNDHSKQLLSNSIPNPKLECQICLQTFNSQCLLSVHTEIHLKELRPKTSKIAEAESESTNDNPTKLVRSLQCDLCPRSFNQMMYLVAHRKRVHNTSEWECKPCSKIFKRRYLLKLHENTVHATVKAVKCPDCEKTFTHQRSLRPHRQTHLSEKQYKCKYCSQSFGFSRSLICHMAKYHGGERPYKCHVCFKAWATKSELKWHLISHSTERKEQCSICLEFFKHRKHLRVHQLRVHMNVKRAKSFHVKHTKSRVFACTICPFESNQNKDVAIHYSKHNLPRVNVSKLALCERHKINNNNYDANSRTIVTDIDNLGLCDIKVKTEEIISYPDFDFGCILCKDNDIEESDKIKSRINLSRIIQLRFKCKHCYRLFDNGEIFNDHLLIH